MPDCTLIAEFATSKLAQGASKEVITFFAKMAKECDALEKKTGHRPHEATPAALAFGKKYGVRWKESLHWGHGALQDNVPEVATLGTTLVLFHDDMVGYGADLPAVLKKAGAKVREEERPPIVYGEIELSPKTRNRITKWQTWFEQRLAGVPLDEWSTPPWSRRRLGFGDAADVSFVADETTCRFALPLQPSAFGPLQNVLEESGGALHIATATEEKQLQRAERLAAARPATTERSTTKTARAKKTAAASTDKPAAKSASGPIPSKVPVVTRLKKSYHLLFSADNALYAYSGETASTDGVLSRGAGPSSLTKVASFARGEKPGALAVDGDEVWAAGTRLWRSTRGDALTPLGLPPSVTPDFWGRQFRGVAKDPTGTLWAGGTWVVRVKNGKAELDKSFGKDARIKAAVATPHGVLLLTFTGLAFLALDTKARRLSLRGKGHLNDACVTPRGTLLVVGSGAKWSAEIHRSEDGGASFKPVRLGKHDPLNAVAVLADGRVVAGGGEHLLAASDDGKTWKPVSTPAGTVFDVLCDHKDGALSTNARIA